MNNFKKLVLLCALLPVIPAYAQTAVSGTKVQDGTGTGSLLASGQWCFSSTCLAVTNGAFSGTVTAGTQAVTVKNASAATILTIPGVVIGSSAFDWNSYVVPAAAIISGTGAPLMACQIGASYTQTDTSTAWACANAAGQATWKVQGGPPIAPSGSYTGNGPPSFACTAPCTYYETSRSPSWKTTASSGFPANSWIQYEGPPKAAGASGDFQYNLAGTLGAYTPSQALSAMGGLPLAGGTLTGPLNLPALVNNTRTVLYGATAPCWNWGDSITAGYFAQPPNGSGNVYSLNGYATLLDTYMGWTNCVNEGVSGSQLMDAAQIDAMLNTSITANTISTILTGANDMRSTFCTGCSGGMSSAAPQAQYMSELEGAMAWLAIPASSKSSAQACPGLPSNPSCVWTGAWSNAGAAGAKQTTTPGDSVTTYLVGSAIYISSIQQFGNTSTYSITVDGTPITPQAGGNFSTAGYISRTFNDAARTYSFNLIRVGGLAETQHAVVITCVTADASDPCYLAWVGSNGASTAGSGTIQRSGPYVFLGNTIRAQAAGYAADGGSDLIVAQFDAMVREVAAQLASDGLQIQLVNDSAVMNPNNASFYYTDGFHPSTAGHAAIAQAFEDAVTGAAVPNDRGAAQILQGVPLCTFNGALEVGGCTDNAQRGDLGAAQSATVGNVYLGRDGSGGLFRNGNNVRVSAGTSTAVFQLGGSTSQFPALCLTGGANPAITACKADNSGSIAETAKSFLAETNMQNGAGLQVATATGCTITAGAIGNHCLINPVNLLVTEPDTSYVVLGCQIANATDVVHIGSVGSLTPSSFAAWEVADTTTATGGGTVACLVWHP